MKKLIMALCIVALSANIVEARPHHYDAHLKDRRPQYHHIVPNKHHSHSDDELVTATVVGGIIGIVWIANLLFPSNN